MVRNVCAKFSILGMKEASEDKKDWRKETESGRCWCEDEIETGGLLAARWDRTKPDRRADVAADADTKALSSDRWLDAGNRSSGHEARRDSKWSCRWVIWVKKSESDPNLEKAPVNYEGV
ncbi:hypothetical protein OROMI_017316 [Orobanche minor]